MVDDAALLEAYKSGDDAALPALLERYEPAVYRFGVALCRHPEDAADVLQDTLLAAARGARGFRGGSSFSTWLFTIARSFCVKKRRRRRGEPAETVPLDHPDSVDLAAPSAPPDEALGDRQLASALDHAIASLSPAHREVLVLRDVEGLSAAEVATVLDLQIDAVKSRLHRARAAVRDRLAPWLAGEVTAPKGPCPSIVPILSRYLEGEIGPAECAEMDKHVAACPSCQSRCDSLKKTLALCRTSATHGEVPRDVRRRIRKALDELR